MHRFIPLQKTILSFKEGQQNEKEYCWTYNDAKVLPENDLEALRFLPPTALSSFGIDYLAFCIEYQYKRNKIA